METNTKKLVEESGIIPHLKTSGILKAKEWTVLVSPYYHDSISDTIRETDLVAERQFDTGYRYGSTVHINLQLFVECKYIKQEVIFWFDKIDVMRAIQAFEKETGLDIVHGGYKHAGDITLEKFHYFTQTDVAKLFSTNLSKEDVIYKAMNQCLHSQLYYRQRGKKPINIKFHAHPKADLRVVQFPIIVCENFEKLLRVQFDEHLKYQVQPMQNHFVLETNYRDDYFLIDVVDINYLDTFLNELESEAKILVSSYSFKRNR